METDLEGLVKVTRTAEEVKAAERKKWERINALLDGLKDCPECGERPRAIVFGAKRRGLWIGCDRTKECLRHICIHTEGWSLEEVCSEWNRKNRWPWSWVKWIKIVWERRFGKQVRWDRRHQRELEEKKRAAEEERKRVFGDFRLHKVGFCDRIIAKVKGKLKWLPKGATKLAKG